MNYLIDFETRSSLDLTVVGAERYLHTTMSDIVCMSYWWKGMPEAKIWLPGLPFPFTLTALDKVYAFNIQFDQRVWNVLGPKYGLPYLPIEQCVDIMALCGRYGYPQKLATVGKVLNLRVQKMQIANNLMKKICSPPFKYTVDQFKQFLRYCLDDTNSMRELLYSLPSDHLSDYDNEIWQMTVKMNRIGLPIDVQMVAKINVLLEKEKAEAINRLEVLTDGAITTPHQRDRIMRFTGLENLQAETVEEALKDDTLDPVVREVLEIRRVYGKAAMSKYAKVMSQIYKGRIFDNLRFYGGHTGRFAGLGFQAHNLFKGDKKIDQEALLQDVYKGRCCNVTSAARNLVRGILKAPPGKTFCVVDYKSIENVLLAHTAGQVETLQLYRDGKDEYKDFASTFFEISYDSVSSEQRTFAKPVILGAGYGLGGPGLQQYAEGYGVTLNEQDAQEAINIYRTHHQMVVKFWYEVHGCMKRAIMQPGTVHSYRGVSIKVVKDRNGRAWAVLTLPSGRNLFYCEPTLETNIFGNPGPTYMAWKDNAWVRVHISPGHLTENIIQALALDILIHGKKQLFKAGYQVDLSVHDEVIVELLLSMATPEVFKDICDKLCTLPYWALGLPLSAEGEFLIRYKKI